MSDSFSKTDLPYEMPDRLLNRVVKANRKPFFEQGDYVLAVLGRALRGEDNLVIDAAITHANAQNIGVVVYSELDTTATYASDRLCYFELGAFRESAIALKKRGLPCLQFIRKANEKSPLPAITAKATAIYTDEEHTVWDRQRIERLLNIAHQTVLFVDASRLVPIRSLPEGLTTTPAFRKAHGELREQYGTPATANFSAPKKVEIATDQNFEQYDDDALLNLVAGLNINHGIKVSAEHPPTQAEITARLTTLKDEILAKYKWIRNNASLEHSTSQLSPYLHFGIVSPHRIYAEILSADIPKSYTWKFRDEFLTWREWSHYQAFYNLDIHEYSALPKEAKQTLEDHASDPRPELKTFDEILHGDTSDKTWNAAQKEWLNTGWLHNNLRMYWSKQILRFTKTPQEAWTTACQINDSVSLDGRDPATYASLRWAFGDAKKGYSEKEIYGWVAPKSNRAILKRTGMNAWIDERAGSQN